MVDAEAAKRSVSALVQCAAPPRRPGADQRRLEGNELRVAPITKSSAPVVLGEDLRDLGAAVAVMHIRTPRRARPRRRGHADDLASACVLIAALPTPARLRATLQAALPGGVEIVDRETVNLGTAPKEIVTCRNDGGLIRVFCKYAADEPI